MQFLKLVVSFAPWIAFLIIARGSLVRVEIALVVALVLAIAMSVARLHRGIIMWVGLAFFTGATIAVLVFHNLWTLKYLGVLASAALALGSWSTLLIGRPFTLEYARQQTDPSQWNNPVFISVNVRLTAVWAAVFTFNALIAWILMERVLLPQWVCHALTYAALVGAAAFTSWYPSHLRRKAQAAGSFESVKPDSSVA